MAEKMTKTQRGVLIAACANIGIVLGLTVNISGLFFEPIMQELHTGIGQISTMLAVYNIAFAVGGLSFPKIAGRIAYRKLAVLSVTAVILATAVISFYRTIAGLYLFSAVRGFFAGFIGPVASTLIVNRWFRERTGFYNGLAFGFSGILGALASPAVSFLIERYNWRTAYLSVAALMIFLALPTFLFPLSCSPEEIGETAYGKAQNVTREEAAEKEFDRRLYLLMFLFPVGTGLAVSFVQHLTPMASSYGFSATVTSLMLSLVLIMNTAGKFVLGVLIDRFGTLRSTLLFSILVMAAGILFFFCRSVSGMYIGSILFGTVYALNNIGMVALTKDLFGIGNYGTVYPKFSFAYTMTTAAGASLFGFMFDWFRSYDIPLVLILFLILACALLEVFAYRETAERE